MTLAAESGVGVDLCHGDVQRCKAVGVERSLDVTLEDADADALEVAHRPLEQHRLAGTRRAHQVDDHDGVVVEVVAVGTGNRVVRVENALDDADPRPMHYGSACGAVVRKCEIRSRVRLKRPVDTMEIATATTFARS